MFKRKKEVKKCEIPDCNNPLPVDNVPGVIYMGEYAFEVCDECEKLMDVIQRKTEEHYGGESL